MDQTSTSNFITLMLGNREVRGLRRGGRGRGRGKGRRRGGGRGEGGGGGRGRGRGEGEGEEGGGGGEGGGRGGGGGVWSCEITINCKDTRLQLIIDQY